jgi:hypothetical protein
MLIDTEKIGVTFAKIFAIELVALAAVLVSLVIINRL